MINLLYAFTKDAIFCEKIEAVVTNGSKVLGLR